MTLRVGRIKTGLIQLDLNGTTLRVGTFKSIKGRYNFQLEGLVQLNPFRTGTIDPSGQHSLTMLTAVNAVYGTGLIQLDLNGTTLRVGRIDH